MSFTKQKVRLVGAFAALATLALAGSCTGFFPAEQLGSFTISPTDPTVPLGGTLQMHAFGTNTDNSPAGDVTGKVTWSSNESGSVSVSSGGLLTGVALSTTPAQISATFQNVSAQTTNATVCVENGTNFAIVPAGTSVTGGGTVPYTASAIALVNGVNTTVDITPSVQWSTGNTSVVTIVSGTDPAIATTTTVGAQTQVLITASYTCNGITNTFTTNLTVD